MEHRSLEKMSSGIIETIKQVAINAFESTNPVKLMFGKVISAEPDPIRIQVVNDNNHVFILDREFLIINGSVDVDDKVTLIRCQGGFKYVVLGTRTEYHDTIINIGGVGNGPLPKIMLNPGHGNKPDGTYDPGATGNGYKEAVLTRELCKLVVEHLKGYADVTVWDYDKDMYYYKPSLDLSDYKYFLSIHFNSAGGQGTEIFHYYGTAETKMDRAILNKVVAAGGFINRGVKTEDFYVLTPAGIPKSLLEVCFIDSASDMNKYASKKDAIAKAIAQGIIEGLGLSKGSSSGNVIDKAVEWALGIANNPAHGYDQSNRWGPNYDCSSFVISAYYQAGLPIFKNGEQEWGNTGTMVSQLTKVGFKDVTKSINLANGNGTQKGDVLLNTASHTAMVVSPGTIVHASINEKGTIKGGESGDQTKKEICTRNYYNKPWNYVLRYTG